MAQLKLGPSGGCGGDEGGFVAWVPLLIFRSADALAIAYRRLGWQTWLDWRDSVGLGLRNVYTHMYISLWYSYFFVLEVFVDAVLSFGTMIGFFGIIPSVRIIFLFGFGCDSGDLEFDRLLIAA
jgi:hypothetical protein